MAKSKRPLRSGYTTGACAAAAARAATELLLGGDRRRSVQISLPGGPDGQPGEKVRFKLKDKKLEGQWAHASVIKDAGDDPDVTNRAEICARVRQVKTRKSALNVSGGKGVGRVTRPGLAVKPGNAAINPVPMKMILTEVQKAIAKAGGRAKFGALDVVISVPDGERLAQMTLNARLGIIGGISILGTTGIVKPLSTDAWTATISASLNVAEAAGLDTVVMSSGRTSERVHMENFGFDEKAYVMMGDHVEWSLKETVKRPLKEIHLAAQWAKMLKIAMGAPDTHVRAGAFSVKKAVPFLKELGVKLPGKDYNTAREIFNSLSSTNDMLKVINKAREYAEGISGHRVIVSLIGYDGEVIKE